MCTANPAEGVTVTYASQQNEFLDQAGQRYVATDIRLLGDVDASRASQRKKYKAIRLAEPNRWGRIPALIFEVSENRSSLWQIEQLQRGLAVYNPLRLMGDCTALLQRAEWSARRQEKSVWKNQRPHLIFNATNPSTISEYIGRFVIVRGQIVSLGKTKRTRYLNFGKYWKTDFTATIRTSDEIKFNKALDQSGLNLEDLSGRFVELRGVVENWDGPHIRLTRAEQLFVFDRETRSLNSQSTSELVFSDGF